MSARLSALGLSRSGWERSVTLLAVHRQPQCREQQPSGSLLVEELAGVARRPVFLVLWLQDSLGNYYDCSLTLMPAEVGRGSPRCLLDQLRTGGAFCGQGALAECQGCGCPHWLLLMPAWPTS
jgi:hypothetical protein